MRVMESTKKRMLGEKRCGMPGRTAPHYEHSPETHGQQRTEAEPHEAKKRYDTHQHKKSGPWREAERGEESRDGAKGQFLIRAEGMHNLRTRMVEDLVCMHRRRRRRWDVESKEVE